MLSIIQAAPQNRNATRKHKTLKNQAPQQYLSLNKKLTCTMPETSTAPDEHPKFMPRNNIQNTQKRSTNHPATTEPNPATLQPPPNPNTPRQPLHIRRRPTHPKQHPRDVSSLQVTRLKHHNSPTQTCDLAQHPIGTSEHRKPADSTPPTGSRDAEHNKQNPTPRPTRTQQLRDIAASARSAFTNLLTTYIATAAHEPSTPST